TLICATVNRPCCFGLELVSSLNSAQALICGSVSGRLLPSPKAGIKLFCVDVTVRPSVITRANSASATMARKSGAWGGGAGPGFPAPPWQPAHRVAYGGPKPLIGSAGRGRSAGSGWPGRSQPAESAARRGNNRQLILRALFTIHLTHSRPTRSFDP